MTNVLLMFILIGIWGGIVALGIATRKTPNTFTSTYDVENHMIKVVIEEAESAMVAFGREGFEFVQAVLPDNSYSIYLFFTRKKVKQFIENADSNRD